MRRQSQSTPRKIKAGIVGGAGYTAGELVRLLLNHPYVQLEFVHSQSSAGKYLWEVHQGLFGETDLKFCSEFDLGSVSVLFLCSAHGKSREFWAEHRRPGQLCPLRTQACSRERYASPR